MRLTILRTFATLCLGFLILIFVMPVVMERKLRHTPEDLQRLVQSQADFIIDNQLPSGAIPWYHGTITDPWDHIEGAIALDLTGRFKEAAAAYKWSRDMQNPDGSWYSSYTDDKPQDLTKDTNFTSYIATGMWFNYLATRDLGFLREMWPMVEKSMEFTLSLQKPTGEIIWALSKDNNPWPGAILTSSSCTWHSIRNGITIAETLGIAKPDWKEASDRLFTAIEQHPELFDREGENDRRYAMNWFYPILGGVVKGANAKTHIDKEWSDFVIDGWGCRVAADEDVTAVAETSELIIALALIGEHARGQQLLDWTLRIWDDKAGFCRGMKLPEQEACPPDEERATWTSAALILAIAALARA
ncbi:MAG: hypothetical protein SVO26_03545 [Chloroflexota bacterium]|nr:hypothetical protein [Chloroflexota bacterium]